MNMKTVGMENLPNIYIENINVIPKGMGSYQIVVAIVMYDKLDIFSKPTCWRNKIDGLNFKCSLISDERIQKMNSGEISLYDVDPSERFTYVDSCDELRPSTIENKHRKYKKHFEFGVSNPQNLNVYVACFIDGLNFGIDLFDKFYGPMSGEKIFIEGEINNDSGYFYYPDTNEEYGGPVHSHNQGYMEGSEHTDEPHSRLVYVPEENFKITSNLFVGSQLAPSVDRFVNPSTSSDNATTGPTSQTMQNPDFAPDDISGGY